MAATDGARIEQSYHDLVFTVTSGCSPESGWIAGKVYQGSTLKQNFTIKFSGGIGMIEYDPALPGQPKTRRYVPAFCSLDSTLSKP